MIYLYYCERCGAETEREFPMEDQPRFIECEGCGGEAGKVILAPAIHYKGTGWTGAGHGIPDMDERQKLPKPWQFDDLMEE